jgi:hypothetical protein
MNYWNSAFNAKRLQTNYNSCTPRNIKTYVAAVQALKKKKRHYETQFTGETHMVPVLSFCKNFIPSYTIDALLRWNWPFSPPNLRTLWITLIAIPNLDKWFTHPTLVLTNRYHDLPVALPGTPLRPADPLEAGYSIRGKVDPPVLTIGYFFGKYLKGLERVYGLSFLAPTWNPGWPTGATGCQKGQPTALFLQ